jgi:thiol-disulfide isomerase/thioredoxin
MQCSTAQDIKLIKFNELEQELIQSDTEIKVINFWATWCKPCIEEIPIFDEKAKNDPSISLLLVSLDFASQKELVNQFVKRKEIDAKIVLLDETDYDAWISKIDSTWSGAIPATIIINNKTKKRIFFEGSLTATELEEKIEQTKQ